MERNDSIWNITDYDVSDLDAVIVKFLLDAFDKFKIKYCPNPPFTGWDSWWNDFFEVYVGLKAYNDDRPYMPKKMEYVPVTQEWLDSEPLSWLYTKRDKRPTEQTQADIKNAQIEHEAAKKAGLQKLGHIIPYLWGTWTEDRLWVDGKLYSPMVEEAERRYTEYQFDQIVENYD